MSPEDNYIAVFGFQEYFLTVIALVASAFVSIHICFGQNTKRAREYSIMLLLLLLVAVQYYHLGHVATYVPASKFFVFDASLVRLNCKKSGKGGKSPLNTHEVYDHNPCFCDARVGVCVDKDTSEVRNATDCPRDSTVTCRKLLNPTERYPPYLDTERDCYGYQGELCTQDQPCHPCELSAVVEFKSSRCRACATDFPGDCHFVPGVGPYCYASPGSRKVVPCKKCCTEPAPALVVNGSCY